MVEGGGDTAASFLEAGVVDEVLFCGAGLSGGSAAPTSVEGRGASVPAALRRLGRST